MLLFYIMIGYLKGRITLKTPAFIYVECSGVGYHVNISLSTYTKISELNEVQIFTYMQVREDDISLYGFFEEDERFLFTQLISVSGIGTNTARVILSYMTADEVKNAIIHENEAALVSVKGIGAKTVKKIIIELKDKIIKKSGIDKSLLTKSNFSSSIKDEALAALIALGFPKVSVEKQINAVINNNPKIENVEELIKSVLKQMN
jgi:holliday junction DNA helicase RuvA